MIIRRCTKNDLDEIYKIEYESIQSPLKRETIEKDIQRDTYFCYGLFEEELVSFISFEKVFDEGQIISVATGAEHRRKGYAKKLFGEMINLAKKDGVKLFTLEVRSNNLPAILLYESLGFKEVGRRKSYYQNPVCDAVLMDLYL